MASSNGTASTSPLVVSSPPPSPSAGSADPSPRPSSASPPTPSVDTSAGSPSAPTASPSQPAASPSSPAEPSSPVTTPTPEPPTSTPINIPSSSPPPPPPSSSPPPSSPSSSNQPPSSTPGTTQTTTASTRPPPSTQIITSVVTPAPSSPGGSAPPPVTITQTRVTNGDPTDAISGTLTASPTNTDPASLQSPGASRAQSGLSSGGKTAIAVVVPVVVVALLVVGGILLWRRRKAKKSDAEARRKEVEEYGYNPNNDPTLPTVGMATEMAEDQSGYRGWGNTTASSHAKGSTTLTSGNTYSDSNSNPGGYQSPGSPTHGAFSDGHSVDPLMNGRRETLDSDGIGALGAAPVANNQGGVHRGPSNASSSYSAAERSDNSGDYPIPVNNSQDYYDPHSNNGYYHATSPYDNNAYNTQQQPIIRDVSARRNTRIENPSVFPQQGNSGIAQNF